MDTSRFPIETLSVDEYSDILGNDLFHFRVRIPSDSKYEIRGFGSDGDKTIALQKAISEAIERSCFFELASQSLASSSSGFACHPDAETAKENARCELIERDVVMSNWLLQKPPLWALPNKLSQDTMLLIQHTVSTFQQRHCIIKFGIWGIVDNYAVLASVITSENGTFGLGLATACVHIENIHQGLNTLISNQRRTLTILFARLQNGRKAWISLKQEEIATPQDHREFYLNTENLDTAEWFLKGGSSTNTLCLPHPKSIRFSELAPKIEMPWKLHIFRAESDECQKYFTGIPKLDKINLPRLRITSDQFSSLNHLPHPLP